MHLIRKLGGPTTAVVALTFALPPIASASHQVGAETIGNATEQTTSAADRSSTRWETLVRWRGARIKACREVDANGFVSLTVRLVNNSERDVRRATGQAGYLGFTGILTWDEIAPYDTRWVNSGRAKGIGYWSTTQRAEESYIRVQAKAPGTRMSELVIVQWSTITLC